MNKIIRGLILAVIVSTFTSTIFAQQGVVYVTDQNGEPWGSPSCVNALNTVFGNGGYTTQYYQNANINTIFSNANCFVYVEGGQNNDTPMNNFVSANQATIQTWVTNGGHLFLNSAGWNSDINCGFGGVIITLNPAYNYASGPGNVIAGQGGHPIFNNVTYPSNTAWTGNYFSHDIITGPSGTSLITCPNAQGNQVGLTELVIGCGKVFFGGMTSTSFHSPQPDADNLRQAILAYMTPCLGQPVSCPTYIAPLNGAIESNCNGPILLSWHPGGGGCGADSIHYLLSFGTDNPPTNIYNMMDIGKDTTYLLTNPGANLVPGQTYYWRIDLIGYGGGALGNDTTLSCNLVWSFSLLGLPLKPNPVGPLNVCPNLSYNYSVLPTAGETYSWTIPAGCSIISSNQDSSSINVLFGATGGNFCVHANNLCGSGPDSCFLVTVYPSPIVSFTSDTINGCAPVSINFSDLTTVAGGAITQWLWDFGDNTTSTLQNPTHLYGWVGTFDVKLVETTSNGCKDSITKVAYINTYPAPKADFILGPQPTTTLDPKIYFTDKSTNAINWFWNFGDKSSADSTSIQQHPTHTYTDSGQYCVTLIVQYNSGCIDTTVKCLHIDGAYALYIPNSFSPNGDGQNEYFMPKGVNLKSITSFEMLIFDRWGNKLYEQTDFSKAGWDGRGPSGQLVGQDVYVYKISATDLYSKQHNYVGHVTVVR